jgi:hypothetical protein
MGGACSRKREQGDAQNEGGMHEGPRGTLSRTISLRWPLKVPTIQKSESFAKHGSQSAPSLLELSLQALCQNIRRYPTLAAMPRDLTQQILNELVQRQLLTLSVFHAFLDCSLQDIMLEEYPGVDDKWLEVIGTQGTSLLALNISGSAVTDAGLKALDMCNNLQALILSYCDHISDAGLISLTGNYVPRIPTAHTHTTFQSFIPSPQTCRNACLHNPFLSPVCSQFSCTSSG